MNIKEIIGQEIDVRKISDKSTLTEEVFDERYEKSQKENEESSRVYLGELVYVVVRGKRINRARIFHYARTGRFRVEFVINGTQLARQAYHFVPEINRSMSFQLLCIKVTKLMKRAIIEAFIDGEIKEGDIMDTESKYDYLSLQESTLDFMENIMRCMREAYKDVENGKVDYKTDVRMDSVFADIEALKANIQKR